ncbi:hypothetical protein [Deinococcus sp. Leaf326]|uniref:hypothetical protein n=1 Tax=Deinococcus sp. Leaf326 TaxID=1736338 RepID=UPI0012E1E1DE|nr:hypothetical protein [Deinococcus sp. Leaf326]
MRERARGVIPLAFLKKHDLFPRQAFAPVQHPRTVTGEALVPVDGRLGGLLGQA